MKYALLIVCLIIGAYSFGQTPDNNWAFGLFGQINFDGGMPNDAGEGPVDSDESSGCISDSNGNLLFSTNGIEVYNRNGQIMPNGTGLKGHWSSSQNVVIVPFPGDDEERFYYIFTVGAQLGIWNNSGDGLEYVVVDMQENGGLGDVIQPSTQLISNTSEKIHATYHTNNRDVWVVVHKMGSNGYYSIPVTCEGIQEPVVSNTGSVYTTDPDATSAVGYMKISHNGPTIASTFNTVTETGEYLANYLDIGSFNHDTGEIIITEIIQKPSEGFGTQGYGLEFSPDNSKLYWTRLGSGGGIFQFDMNISPVAPTEFLISNSSPSVAGMLLAPDGKIYLTHSGFQSYLSMLSNPNETGANVIMEIGVNITNQAKLGLPNNWMYPYPEPESFSETEMAEISFCPNQAVLLGSEIDGGQSYLWNTGEQTQTIEVSQAGTYTLQIGINCNTIERIFLVSESPLPLYSLDHQFEICEGESASLSVSTNENVLWFNGETEHSVDVYQSGLFAVQISNDACSVEEFISVNKLPLPKFSIKDYYETCDDLAILIDVNPQNVEQFYLDGFETEHPINIQGEGIYTLIVENKCGEQINTFEVARVSCDCHVYIPNSFTPNGDGLNDLLKPICDCDMQNFEFLVFDRWGALVFKSNEILYGWNGSLNGGNHYLPAGIYAYKATWEASKNGQITYGDDSGHLTLLR